MQELQTIAPDAQGALFDYGALDQETQVLVRLRASEIKSAAKRIAADVVEIGGKLAEVKDRVGGNGKFNDWLSGELGWSERTAYNFIAVWQKFGAANFALENVATSALYLLAAPSTPAEAVEVAKQIADSGEEVTHTVAKEIVRQAKAKRPKQKELIEEPEEAEEETPAQEAAQAVDPSAICLCSCKAGDHVRDGRYGECCQCDCEMFQEATAEEIAERQAAEKALGIWQSAAPAPVAAPALVSAQKPAVVETAETFEIHLDPAVWVPSRPLRPAEWFKTRIEINITLMPGSEPRKIMHSVRAGDGSDDIPFVAVSSGEAELLDFLPPITRGLVEKAAEAFAKKQASKPAKSTNKSKPAAKKPATKSKSKKGEKK